MTPEVPIEVRSRHESVSDRIKGYAVEKANKLLRFHDRISRIQICFDAAADKKKSLEIIVHVDSGHVFVAKEVGEYAKETVDLLVEKMARQIRKDKEKLKSHHKPDAVKGGGRRRVAGAGTEPSFDDIVAAELRPRRRR